MARKEFHWWDDLDNNEGCLLVAGVFGAIFIVYIVLAIFYPWMR